MVSPSPSSQGPTWVLTGLTNLDMAGQRDVYREVDGLGERWCEMTDVVVGESSLRRCRLGLDPGTSLSHGHSPARLSYNHTQFANHYATRREMSNSCFSRLRIQTMKRCSD